VSVACNLCCQIDHLAVLELGLPDEQLEGLVGATARGQHDHTLGLTDQVARFQRSLEVLDVLRVHALDPLDLVDQVDDVTVVLLVRAISLVRHPRDLDPMRVLDPEGIGEASRDLIAQSLKFGDVVWIHLAIQRLRPVNARLGRLAAGFVLYALDVTWSS